MIKKGNKNIVTSFLRFVTVIIALILVLIPISIGFVMYFNAPVRDGERHVVLSQNDAIKLTDNGYSESAVAAVPVVGT